MPQLLTENVHAFLRLLHQSVVVIEISVYICRALCVDIVSDLGKLAHILVTEIGV